MRTIDELGGICEFDGCEDIATVIVYSRLRAEVMLCCTAHSEIVVDYGSPEYHQTCHNCGCLLPIN